MATRDDLKDAEAEELHSPLKNSFGRGGRASAAARQHYLAAVDVLAEVMHSKSATDEARVRAAEVIINVARAK